MIGTRLTHYILEEKLGEGGMGVVYKAEDTKLKRGVALKFLHANLTQDEDSTRRFTIEAQAASALDHFNICTIHEIDETEDGQLFICMTHYDGETLKEKIKRGPLPIQEAISIAIQIAQGLSRAHEAGISHRDIKPGNIIITDRGEVKVLDFGLAELVGQEITHPVKPMGTIAYMSPEQVRGLTVDYRTDIWSFGVVLYELITGQMPFKGKYEPVVIYSILNKEPDPMTDLRTDVPMELERIVNKTMAKSPNERYQHMDELLTDLKRIRKGLATSGELQPSKAVDRESRRKRFEKIFVSVGIVLFIALGFLLLKPQFFQQALVSEPKQITVISFENQTGDPAYDYLRVAIPNLLITNLEQSKYLRVTTWERLHDLLKQMGEEDVQIIDKNLGFELCRMDGVEAIVLGSFTKAGDIFATDVKVLDVASKTILKSASSKGKGIASILEIQIDELSRDISRGVGISERRIEATQRPIAVVTTTSMQAYNYYVRGGKEIGKWHWDDARRFLEKALELDSTFAMAYLSLGWAYDGLRDPQARLQAFQKAKHFSHKATDKERLYIETYYAWVIEKNTEKHLGILKEIVKKYPKEKIPYLDLAQHYRDQEFYDEAIAEFNKALALDPNFGLAIRDLAKTYAQMENYEKAIEHLERYASVSPGDPLPFTSMADIFFKMGRLDEAISKYKEALEVKPDFGSEWLIGYMYALQEDYHEAMKWIEQAITMAPSPGRRLDRYCWKAFFHYWLGNLEISFGYLRRISDLAKETQNQYWIAAVDRLKGWFYCDRGEYELSMRHFKSWTDFAIKYFPDRVPLNKSWFNYHLGLVNLRQGRIDSAKSRLAEMKSFLPKISLDKKDNIIYLYDILYGEILLAQDSVKKAIAICKKAPSRKIHYMTIYELVPYNVPFVDDLLARAYHQKGELDKAIAEYERLFTFETKSKNRHLIHPKYHYRLAKLYQEKGWAAKAIEQYEKFLELWKDADQALPEPSDARQRLLSLKSQYL
ncbi:MAG: protein kinase [Phycisphaerae bacterium]|nr:protein kinase [Fodinibius sp.]NIU59884.1 protein kinase [Phycisphaerae bacterium]NIV13157.1 protein kinase [Fodinibius sp.]NIY26821.1 protein kinase [Fodinibius sp.]